MQYRKSFTIYVLIILVVILGIGGIYGGASLVNDPTGKDLVLPLRWLQASPFKNYLIPGIILLTVLGIFPIAAAAALIMRSRGALTSARIVGYALIIWMAVELYIVGYQPQSPLQLIFGLLGVLILLLAYSSRVTNYYL